MITIPEALSDWTEEAVRSLLDAHVYEDPRLDWKEDVQSGPGDGDRFVRGAAAMANGRGGFFVLGVTDDRTVAPSQRIVGIDVGRDLTQQVAELLKQADPPVPLRVRNPPLSIAGQLRRVLPILEIEAGLGPHSYKGVFSRRDGSTTRPMTTAEVQDMFIRREEQMRRLRLLVVELVAAREAALAINLVTASRKVGLLRSIDTRVIAELHAAILPLLSKDEALSQKLSQLRAQADVLNFRVASILPLFYGPKLQEKRAEPDFDVFIETSGDAYSFAGRWGDVIVRLCGVADLPTPKLLEVHELRDRGF